MNRALRMGKKDRLLRLHYQQLLAAPQVQFDKQKNPKDGVTSCGYV